MTTTIERPPEAERIDALRNRVRELQGIVHRQSRLIVDLMDQVEQGEHRNYETLRHVGAHPHRALYGTAEAVYQSKWADECRRRPGLNSGYGALEHLLNTLPQPDHWFGGGGPKSYVSQRDAFVAATAIQWLGTNCGRCFVQECEKEIEKRRKDEETARRAVHESNRPAPPSDSKEAHRG